VSALSSAPEAAQALRAPPVGSDHSDESRRVVVPLPFGLCAVYILREKPRQPCREREPGPW
jgi:hypothetical protein